VTAVGYEDAEEVACVKCTVLKETESQEARELNQEVRSTHQGDVYQNM